MRRPVLLLDDDDDVLQAMADVLEELAGRRVLKAHSLDELIALGDEALGSETAILDINLGRNRPSGIDALRWLAERAFAGRVIFLTGHAAGSPLVEQARWNRGVEVIAKPIGCKRLLGLVESP